MKEAKRALTPSLAEMCDGPFVPGRNADPAALAVKRAHLRDPHVQPFNDLADAIADSEGIPRGFVPYVDPQLGGVNATVLALLDNPSTKAEAGTGSGLLSLENNDLTAKNCAAFYNNLGLRPGQFVHWNVAPAPIAGEKNGQSSNSERERGARWLKDIVELLPNLRVILLMGDNARDGWKKSGLNPDGVFIPLDVPHPSQRGLNNREGRVRLRRALLETKKVLEDDRKPRRTLQSPRQAAVAELSGKRAWWPTFEHYCAPGSNPWGVSSSFKEVERAADRYRGRPGKWCVIARRSGSDWTLVARRKDQFTKELASYQVEKYDAARAGGPRGNLGKVPQPAELRFPTRDLDR